MNHIPYFTHLKLKKASLFLHLFCNLPSADLCSDQTVLLGMFPFFFLNLVPVNKFSAFAKKTLVFHQCLIMLRMYK